jgi:DNA mismatch endonuclease, patch repair protein
MRANRSRDTGPELAVRRLVHAMGLRYRVNARPVATLRRTADLVFTRRRVAVFIDGCFWHGCPDHHRQPSANADYWSAKVARNRGRDIATDETLAAAGWTVLRFWEHERPEAVAEAVRTAVRREQ